MIGDANDRHLPEAALIDAYGNGGFRFAGMSHRGSLLCLPDGVWAWPVERSDQIDEGTLARIFARAADLDTLVVGTGRQMAPFPVALRNALRARGVIVDSMQTGPAIRMYNIMMGERRRVAAALIAVP